MDNMSVISFIDGYAFSIMLSESLLILGLLILIVGMHILAKSKAGVGESYQVKPLITSAAVSICGVVMLLGSFFIS